MTDVQATFGPAEAVDFEPPWPRRRRRGWAMVPVAVVLGVVVLGFAAPGLFGTWTTRGTGGVPGSITTPWSWQANVQTSPPGPAALIFTGVGTSLLDVEEVGRIGVVGRNGSYRSLYPDHGRWTAGANAHLSPDGRFVASLSLRGVESEVSITDLSTGEVRNLPRPLRGSAVAVYGWRPDGRAVAIGFRTGYPLAIGMIDVGTGATTLITTLATTVELAGVVTVAFSPDGQRLAVARGVQIQLFDLVGPTSDRTPLWTMPLDPAQQFSGVFTPDGRLIVLFGTQFCLQVSCPPEFEWTVSYLDTTTGESTTGPPLQKFTAASARAVGWNQTTGGLVIVGLTRWPLMSSTDADERQLIQSGAADLYELSGAGDPRLLVEAPDEVTGLDVALDLVRGGSFGAPPSVPSLLPFEPAAVDRQLEQVAVPGAIVALVALVVGTGWRLHRGSAGPRWLSRSRPRHRRGRAHPFRTR